MEAPITLEEVEVAVAHLKPGSAPGIDGIPAEFYKRFIASMGSILLDAFVTKTLETGDGTSKLEVIETV